MQRTAPAHEPRSHPQYRCHAVEPTLRRTDTQRYRLPRAGEARQGPLPHARRRTEIRRTEGNQNARKHGAFAQDGLAAQRAIRELLGETRKLLAELKSG